MDEQSCILVKHLYRRDRKPRSIEWYMNRYALSAAPEVHVPGFVKQIGAQDQLAIVLALPCSLVGEVENKTQYEYEGLCGQTLPQDVPRPKAEVGVALFRVPRPRLCVGTGAIVSAADDAGMRASTMRMDREQPKNENHVTDYVRSSHRRGSFGKPPNQFGRG